MPAAERHRRKDKEPRMTGLLSRGGQVPIPETLFACPMPRSWPGAGRPARLARTISFSMSYCSPFQPGPTGLLGTVFAAGQSLGGICYGAPSDAAPRGLLARLLYCVLAQNTLVIRRKTSSSRLLRCLQPFVGSGFAWPQISG